MRPHLRPQRPDLRRNQREDGDLPCLGVHRHSKSILKQGAHHQPHLVLGSLTANSRFNIKVLGTSPIRKLGSNDLNLITRHLPGKDDVLQQQHINR